ncbi:MAG: cell division protein FtsW [Eubacteriaceae bacterium]|nr:cell division protein FtsW [Eubacteriaceae bacterium]
MKKSFSERFTVNTGHLRKYIYEMIATIPHMVRDMRYEAKKRCDTFLVLIIIILLTTGVVMIRSASMYETALSGGNNNYAASQAVYALSGLVVMYAVSLVNYRYYKKYAGFLMFVMFVFLTMVFLGFGTTYMGANRGLSIGPVSFMPVEPTKIAVLLFMAHIFDKHLDKVHTLKMFICVFSFCAVLALLIVEQPALSSGIIVAGLIIGMFFMAGARLRYIFLIVISAVFAVGIFIISAPWRLERFFAFLDPFADLHGDGWQPAQSLMALGSGGIFGQGIGNGVAKLSYLPESQNDYIFSIIGEELGLVGCIFVITAFMLLIVRLMKTAFSAKDMFGRMISSGMAVLIGIQVFLNLMVVTNSMPSTGVSLPFISYGGSSLITLLMGMGIVLNVTRNIR